MPSCQSGYFCLQQNKTNKFYSLQKQLIALMVHKDYHRMLWVYNYTNLSKCHCNRILMIISVKHLWAPLPGRTYAVNNRMYVPFLLITMQKRPIKSDSHVSQMISLALNIYWDKRYHYGEETTDNCTIYFVTPRLRKTSLISSGISNDVTAKTEQMNDNSNT